MSTRPSRLLVVALVALLAVGCQLDVAVRVAVEPDGSGEVGVEVRLDEQAVGRLGGIEQLRTDDLTAAGWVVAGPVVGEAGGAVVSASKRFADPVELGEVLAEVSGPDGPYAGLALEIDRPFARTRYRLDGLLDGSVGVAGFADPGVAAALGGLPFGQDLEALAAELGGPVGERVALALAVSLPGGADGSTVAPDGGVVAVGDTTDGAPVWRTDLAASTPVVVLATGEELRIAPLAWLGAAAALGVLAVVVIIAGLVRALARRRRRRRTPRPAPVDSPTPTTPAPEPAAAAAATGRPDPGEGGGRVRLELVLLGAPGVVFGVSDEVDELLVPFARARGCDLPAAAIGELHTALCLGRIDTAELWEHLRVPGDPEHLDEAYLGGMSLGAGVRDFAARAREQGYVVGCVADGPLGWSVRLREEFHLDRLLDPWVVSADVGARPPAIGPFEAARRTLGIAPAACLVIDARLDTLDVLRRAGYGTAWCSATGRAVDAPGHALIRGVDGLLRG